MATVNPVVLVTGASRGIGLSVVKTLLSLKASVVGTGRSTIDSLPEVQQLQADFPSRFVYVSTDITGPTAADDLVKAAVSSFSRVDAVVHNAGILEPMARIADADLEEWKKCLDVNLYSGIALFQKAAPQLRSNQGRFILVSSGAAAGAKEGWVPYCTAKAAANMLVSGLGLEEKNITSVAVRPGVVDTEMQRTIREMGRQAMGEESHRLFLSFKEDGKLLSPDVPGYVIAKLALEAPKDISGQFINWSDERLASFQKPK
ncbi:hypothetical protein DFS34DRAFT_642962 [Phlyctochytrium arcticum]|nr:hypothetical protein DFS34DRAFT_642962 [Phlyctochytrium arcticum]